MGKMTMSDGGFMVVTAGKHKNKTVYWDDDESLPCGVKGAIVYFGKPCVSAYATVKHSSLRKATKSEIKAFKTQIDAP